MECSSGGKTVYWDNLKGIFIFLVVLADCLYSLQDSAAVNVVTDMIFVFHMPAFVFVSGFLSRSDGARAGRALLTLAAAYILFNPPMQLYAYARYGTLPGLVTPSYSYWFLVALILWRLTVGHVSRLRGALAVCVAAALLAGFFRDVTNVFAAARTVAFYPFFLAGYRLSDKRARALYGARKKRLYAWGALLLGASLAASYLLVKTVGVSDGALTMSAYDGLIGLPVRAAIFAAAAAAVTGFLLAVPDKRIPCLTTLGSNSMSVFLLHRIPTLLVGDLLSGQSGAVRLVGAAAAAVLISALFANRAVAACVDRLVGFVAGLIGGKKAAETF